MTANTLSLASAMMEYDLMTPEHLPALAVEALLAGLDSESLRLLAGADESDSEERKSLLTKALAELSIQEIDRRAAVDLIAQDLCEKILSDSVTPYEGAKRLWKLSLAAPEIVLDKLDSFVYAASEWEDRPSDRKFFEEEITKASQDFLARHCSA